MPIGIVSDLLSILIGSIIGINFKHLMPERIKVSLIKIFGICALTIGIVSLMKINSLPAVIFALIFGYLLGESLNCDTKLKAFILSVIKKFKFNDIGDHEQYIEFYIIVTITFCASGTNIFGAFNEGISGDSSILISKAVMDILASLIFASRLGKPILFILLPQSCIMLSLFCISNFLTAFITANMIADFIAIGGLLTIILGMSILELITLKLVNLLPALIIIFPVSHFFSLLLAFLHQ